MVFFVFLDFRVFVIKDLFLFRFIRIGRERGEYMRKVILAATQMACSWNTDENLQKADYYWL